MSGDKPREWTAYRSAVTGRFVSAEFAEANPDTTVAHRYTERERC